MSSRRVLKRMFAKSEASDFVPSIWFTEELLHFNPKIYSQSVGSGKTSDSLKAIDLLFHTEKNIALFETKSILSEANSLKSVQKRLSRKKNTEKGFEKLFTEVLKILETKGIDFENKEEKNLSLLKSILYNINPRLNAELNQLNDTDLNTYDKYREVCRRFYLYFRFQVIDALIQRISFLKKIANKLINAISFLVVDLRTKHRSIFQFIFKNMDDTSANLFFTSTNTNLMT